jgi:hypothetical protein
MEKKCLERKESPWYPKEKPYVIELSDKWSLELGFF